MGTGSIGTRHLKILRGLGSVTPVAVPKRRERLAQLAEEGYDTAASLDEAMDKGITLGIVASETGLHVADGSACIQRGLDILVEKPLAVSAAQAGDLSHRGQAANRKIFVGCVMRFSESLNTFREYLPKVGRVHNVRIECQSYLPDWRPGRPYLDSYAVRPEEGGVLLELIHEVDYACWIFGWPDAVQGRLKNTGSLGIAPEEVAELSWETPAAGVLSVYLDFLSRPPRRRMRACGEGGTIEWDGIAGTTTLWVDNLPAEVVQSTQDRDGMFTTQARAFLDAAGGNRDPRLATGEDGVKTLAVCDAARQGSESREEAKVTYP